MEQEEAEAEEEKEMEGREDREGEDDGESVLRVCCRGWS